jgi:hypothetical protein
LPCVALRADCRQGLKNLRNLKELDLTRTQVTADAVAALQKALM